ncbi:MAG: nucleoside monophosphate kinase [Chloroflexi bacterium]|nr:nucleoside monophosphate kinase [Chloroflexota bacterium]
MYVLLLGAPGAGKGTQAERIVRELGLHHVASGDVMRAIRQEDSPLAEEVRSYYDKGLLVPDGLVINVMLARLADASGALLDGFPRTLDQAKALDEALAAKGQQIDKVVYINVPAEELIGRMAGRWLCRLDSGHVYHERNRPPKTPGVCDVDGGELYQRPDDTVATAQRRLDEYFKLTAPLIDYYGAQGKLCEVDGGRGFDEVGRDLMGCLRAA